MEYCGPDTDRLIKLLDDIRAGKTTDLIINGFKDLTHLPKDLPDEITVIYCLKSSIRRIDYLPKNLVSLIANDTWYLTDIPDELPNKLRELYMPNSDLQRVPKLPESLLLLDISNNEDIRELPELPDGITRLSFNFTRICTVKKLPKSLEYLSCNFTSVNYLPELPPNLMTIQCFSLRDIPEIPEKFDFFYSDLPSEFCPLQDETTKQLNERLGKIRAKNRCELIMCEFLAKLAAPVFIEKIMKEGGIELFMDIFPPYELLGE
jgi:hypothetical protein